MKKLFAAFTFLFAAAAAVAQTSDSTVAPGGVVDWLYVKAVSVSCKHPIAGLDAVTERALAQTAANDKGVVLTKANFENLVRQPKADIQAALGTSVASLGMKTPEECAKSIAWAEKTVKAARERATRALD